MKSKSFRSFAAGLMLSAALAGGTVAVSGCGVIGAATAITSLFKIRNTAKRIKRAKKVLTMIGSVLGQYSKTTTRKSLAGTWTYAMPAIQFDNQKSLAAAGGIEACQSLSETMAPYFDKLGMEFGKFQVTFNGDNSAVYKVGDRSVRGSYSFDEASGKIIMKVGLIPLPPCYVSVEDSQMALTFDASRLTSVVKVAGLVSDSNSVMGISSLAESHDGMKTGFSFLRTE